LIGRAKTGKVILATESFPGGCQMPVNSGIKQMALLDYGRSLIPVGESAFLV
jgi:hypothetical protein